MAAGLWDSRSVREIVHSERAQMRRGGNELPLLPSPRTRVSRSRGESHRMSGITAEDHWIGTELFIIAAIHITFDISMPLHSFHFHFITPFHWILHYAIEIFWFTPCHFSPITFRIAIFIISHLRCHYVAIRHYTLAGYLQRHYFDYDFFSFHWDTISLIISFRHAAFE